MSAHILGMMFAAGLTARIEGTRLLVSPAGRITPVMRGLIRANKGAIMAMLRGSEAPEPGPGEISSRDGITGEAHQ